MDSVAKVGEELKELLERLDMVVLEKALERGRRVYKRLVEEIDRLLMKGREGTLSVEHIRPVWYTTCLGPVRVGRRQYRDERGGYRYLLDEAVGTSGSGRATSKVKQLALELAAEMSFRRSERTLEKTTGVHLSHQTMWKLLGEVADPYLERGQRDIERLLETGEVPEGEGKKIADLMVEADGVMMSLQREKERKAEVKVGIAYEGWERVGKDRYRTVNKTIHSDVSGSEVYWAGLSLKLERKYDLGGVARTVIGGDGAGWIKEGTGYLGGTFQLCRYHLNRELTYALGPDRDMVRAVKKCCDRGEVEKASRMLSEAGQRAKGEQALRIERARRYIVDNETGLRDYRLDLGEEGRKRRRTGAMEGNVDKLVVRRMKNQGMSWTVRGIRRMVCVRFLYLEGNIQKVLTTRGSTADRPRLPERTARRLIDSAARTPHLGILETAIPALSGPHANRPWAQVLKSLARGRTY
jgi:hypothetical protein